MLALAAAIVFAFELLLDLFDVRTGDWDSSGTLLFLGLLLCALHLWFVHGCPTRWYARRDRV